MRIMRAWRYRVLGFVVVLLLVGLPTSRARAELDEAITDRVLPTVVQLGPVWEVKVPGGTELRAMGWGSGTIVSADGLILTNNHVVDVSEMVEQFRSDPNVTVLEGKVAVFLTLRSDDPPVLTYFADVVAASPTLDLAVVRVTSDITQRPLDSAALRLPFLTLGDSDALKNLQAIYVFGYPAIGGATITTTEGTVSGFDRQQGVEGRAWIKTSAAISGGNSGGTTVDRNGNLIGVPTRAGVSSSGDSFVDCRRVADTNGDGRIDNTDSCVPIGAFINSLRPINLAKPLIEQARTGTLPTPPQLGPVDDGQTTASAGFGPITFASGVDQAGLAINANTSFPANTDQLHGFFDYSGVATNTPFRVVWLVNGQVTSDDTYPWTLPEAGRAYVSQSAITGQVLAEGSYELRLSLNGQEVQRAMATVGDAAPTPQEPPATEDGVRLTGQIVDAASGVPIAEAIVVMLKEGIFPEAYQGQADQILEAVKTDRDGTFTTTAPLRRGASYGIIIVAPNYRSIDGAIDVQPNAPSILTVQGLAMQPK